MWLYPVFRWFQANPWAKWVAGIAAAFVAFRVWLWRKIKSERKDAKAEGKREVIEHIETKEAELKEAANEAENRITADLNERSLRDVAARSPENLGPVRRTEAD
jgi:hypothetical protein